MGNLASVVYSHHERAEFPVCLKRFLCGPTLLTARRDMESERFRF
jgi:hypothetical protein